MATYCSTKLIVFSRKDYNPQNSNVSQREAEEKKKIAY